ncbi:MAG: Hsp20/alpha crystallin family protein [Prochloraceae cyanobacterium]|nr:Hsp20/alpha crystallin family protein [Prochloraceae cyanobacterium]
MAIVTWNPFSEIETMRRQMDRLFDDMTGGFDSPRSNLWKPPIELLDSEDRLILKAIIPGIEAKDLDVNVARESISIKGEYRNGDRAENSRIFYTEIRHGKFKRVINLPIPIQNDKVEAEYVNGILILNLPKTEAAKNTVVKVNLAATDSDNLPEIAPVA